MPWRSCKEPTTQLRELLKATAEIGILVVEFGGDSTGPPLPWETIEPWTRTRAVTAADVREDLCGPGLDVALCCDLVYLREGTVLDFPAGGVPTTAGQTWALSRAGRPALVHGLLTGGPITGPDAVRTGLAHELVPAGRPLPIPSTLSIGALTAARDLMRCRVAQGPGRALELATFRLLFAAGDPEEGARAFLEKRRPRFPP